MVLVALSHTISYIKHEKDTFCEYELNTIFKEPSGLFFVKMLIKSSEKLLY